MATNVGPGAFGRGEINMKTKTAKKRRSIEEIGGDIDKVLVELRTTQESEREANNSATFFKNEILKLREKVGQLKDEMQASIDARSWDG